jgi:acyl-CoA thioester hydrolase
MNINYKSQPVMMTCYGAHRFKSQSSVKIEFDCEIFYELDELTNAQFILVFVSKTGRPTAPPDYILNSKKIE